MSELGSDELGWAEETGMADRYASDLRCLIVMMAHLALDSEETNGAVIRPGLLRLAHKILDRMDMEFYDDIVRLGEGKHGVWDALLTGHGRISGRKAMRAMYQELKRIGFEQRFFND